MITRTDIYAMCPNCPGYVTDLGELHSDCDKCEFVSIGGLRKCKVYAFKLSTGEVCVVDLEDKPKVLGYNWRTNRHGHVEATINGKKVFIHQVVMPKEQRPPDTIPDHKHGDKLDNRKSQLRAATNIENRRNRRKKDGASSKYTGVYWSKSQQRWVAAIQSNGEDGKRKHRRLGSFHSEDEAARAWNKAALAEYGEFAPVNKIGE